MTYNDLKVEIRYIPPFDKETPADCRAVRLIGSPRAWPFDRPMTILRRLGEPDTGIDVIAHQPSPDGGGSINFLLGIRAAILWDVEFNNSQGKRVQQTHQVFVSFPMMIKFPFSKIFIMSQLPWLYFKIPFYAVQVSSAFLKMQEIIRLMALIGEQKQGLCPKDLDVLKAGFRALENELNGILHPVAGVGDRVLNNRLAKSGLNSGGAFAGRALA